MNTQDEINALVEIQSVPVQTLTAELRSLIQGIRPELQEDVSTKLGNIYFKQRGVVCALSLHKAHVNLHFYRGTELSDPPGVLQGSGKKLRHLKFTRPADIQPEIVERLVNEAVALNQA